MRATLIIMITLLLSACSTTNGVPKGAVAWCGSFEHSGTFIKSEAAGRALGLSDSELANKLTVEDVIALATSMGCDR
ncbi:MAG: hypothetical protein Q8K97_12520 [Pseudohongiella sp.]|nr:hypothetical protein [Pseudohongiella sp.]